MKLSYSRSVPSSSLRRYLCGFTLERILEDFPYLGHFLQQNSSSVTRSEEVCAYITCLFPFPAAAVVFQATKLSFPQFQRLGLGCCLL